MGQCTLGNRRLPEQLIELAANDLPGLNRSGSVGGRVAKLCHRVAGCADQLGGVLGDKITAAQLIDDPQTLQEWKAGRQQRLADDEPRRAIGLDEQRARAA